MGKKRGELMSKRCELMKIDNITNREKLVSIKRSFVICLQDSNNEIRPQKNRIDIYIHMKRVIGKI